MNKIFKVGLIGCGHIAETYFRGQQYFNNFKIIACADIDQKAAEKCAKLYNIKSKTVSEILKDNEIEVISFVGDGSYLLNNTDIYSSVITKNKLIIIVCDNGGFAVINRLQLFKGGK